MAEEDTAIRAAIIQQQTTRQDRRAVIHSEAVKGLMILYGGGAVAVLGFLQAVWNDAKQLVPWTLVALGFFAIALALTACVNYLRVECALGWESWFSQGDAEGLVRGKRLGERHFRAVGLSLVLFLGGVLILIMGGFTAIPQTHDTYRALGLGGAILLICFLVLMCRPHWFPYLIGVERAKTPKEEGEGA